MGFGAKLMEVVVKVRDVVDLAKRFEESPAVAMREVVAGVRQGFQATLERVMDAEIVFFSRHRGWERQQAQWLRHKEHCIQRPWRRRA